MRRLALFAMLLFGCTAVQQQKAQPPRPDDLHFHNLQVFPQNIPRDELFAQMKGFTRALGVTCEHCHVPTGTTGADGEPEYDFPNDAKHEKHAARIMLRMTQDINRNYVSKIEDMYTTVSCWTCHRGQERPDVAPSAEPES
jgi:hypothetical protein